jgi:hypothetical protein
MKMTARDEKMNYHNEIIQIMRQSGLILDEEQNQMEQYLWNSLEGGVN